MDWIQAVRTLAAADTVLVLLPLFTWKAVTGKMMTVGTASALSPVGKKLRIRYHSFTDLLRRKVLVRLMLRPLTEGEGSYESGGV